MKTKTLILAAPPQAFEGIWVELEVGYEWECRVIGEPDEPSHGSLLLDVLAQSGAYTVILNGCKTQIVGGARVRARILYPFAKRGHVTVLMEARNGSADRK